MNKRYTLIAGLLTFVWSTLVQPVDAIDIVWFEQRTAGSAAGELRLANLKSGKLEIRTPGRNLEMGIARFGDQAVVTLSKLNPERPRLPNGERMNPETLTVTAHQGDSVARATFALVLADEAVKTRDKSSEGKLSPAVSNLGNDPVSPASLGMADEPERTRQPSDDSCPTIVIRPGSLKRNIQRLLGECGANLGEWVTRGEHLGFYTDWIVDDPVVLSSHNDRGLEGLLTELKQHYGLQGVRHPRLPHTVNIYKISNEEE